MNKSTFTYRRYNSILPFMIGLLIYCRMNCLDYNPDGHLLFWISYFMTRVQSTRTLIPALIRTSRMDANRIRGVPASSEAVEKPSHPAGFF